MKHFILIALILVIVAGCKRDPKPKEALKDKVFIDVLVDIHIAEGIYSERNRLPIDSLKSELLFESVLKKYNVTEEEMVVTSLYYSRHPREYDKVYNEVLSKLSAMLEEGNQSKDIDTGK